MAAGRGSRISLSQTIHKALLPVGNKAVISHIIDKHPKEVEIIIACGYKSNQIKNFVKLAYVDRKITFVDVDKWEGKGSGPGYSLLQCKPHLNTPFVFTSADTITVEETIPPPDHNWIGVASVDDTAPYLVAEVRDAKVINFHDKQPNLDHLRENAFIGIAGVLDHEAFWASLTATQNSLVKDELQVMNGLNGLINKNLTIKSLTWHDTGNDETYTATRAHFKEVVAPKKDEYLYMQDDQVIKFFADPSVASVRVTRANFLENITPQITGHTPQFYRYNKVRGTLLSETHDNTIFLKFLDFLEKNLWQPIALTPNQEKYFKLACDQFYRHKTEQRIAKMLEENNLEDQEEVINGIPSPAISTLLAQIDWNYLANGAPTKFHGDVQPENIIVTPDENFSVIDWRHDFGGLLEYGDMYYDLAKLDHALLLNAAVTRAGQFSITKQDNHIQFEFFARSHLLDYRAILHDWITRTDRDLNKVKLLTSLVFMNLAPLHESPYNLLAHYLGKHLLTHANTNEHSPANTAIRS